MVADMYGMGGCRVQLQEAYDVLIDLESRELYNLRRELWGFLPNMFLPRTPYFLTPSLPFALDLLSFQQPRNPKPPNLNPNPSQKTKI